MLHEFAEFATKITADMGYFGIFILTTLESTILPLPSEVVLLPAGYLCFKGQMSITLLIAVASLGTLCGALINYFLAFKLGRPFLLKYGKYFLMKEKTFFKTEEFFIKYGQLSTFIGRLLPVVRHLISLFAGLYKMSLVKFILYTSLGGFIWCTFLTLLGYFGGGYIA